MLRAPTAIDVRLLDGGQVYAAAGDGNAVFAVATCQPRDMTGAGARDVTA